MSGRRPAGTAALLLALAALTQASPACAEAAKPPAPLSDALKAPRPKGGEYFGLYLMGKKVGYVFTDLRQLPSDPSRAEQRTELVFKANVGANVSERLLTEHRVYEAKAGGRLLSFVFEQRGDGGNQRLEGTATAQGVTVKVTRPGHPLQTVPRPPTRETIEDADSARVAALRGKPHQGFTLDSTDLEQYEVTTTPSGSQERTVGGVKVKLTAVTTLSSKEKVPVQSFLTSDGKLVEISFGQTMTAFAEPESTAKRLDRVEVFGLTRVVLPRPLPPAARQVPGKLTLVVSGLPEKFQQPSERQRYAPVPGGNVAVTLTARAPEPGALKPLPTPDPDGGVNLKSTLAVEAEHPEIRSLAQKLVAGEQDAYAATKKIGQYVFRTLGKAYGASADRATDVLRQNRGDCTEHSLLMVSLLRAAGIPARRVDGLVYMVNDDQVPALYWHEWVEAFVGTWTQLDPTFGQDVADATHVALGREGNAEITPLIGALKVIEVRP